MLTLVEIVALGVIIIGGIMLWKLLIVSATIMSLLIPIDMSGWKPWIVAFIAILCFIALAAVIFYFIPNLITEEEE